MNDAITEAAAAGKKTVFLVTAPSWCVPCQRFEPHFKRASQNVDDVVFLAADLDNNQWLVQDYGIQSVPTCWLFDEDGDYDRTIKVPVAALPFINDIRS